MKWEGQLTIFSIDGVENGHHVGHFVLKAFWRPLGVVLVLGQLHVVHIGDLVPSVNLKCEGL